MAQAIMATGQKPLFSTPVIVRIAGIVPPAIFRQVALLRSFGFQLAAVFIAFGDAVRCIIRSGRCDARYTLGHDIAKNDHAQHEERKDRSDGGGQIVQKVSNCAHVLPLTNHMDVQLGMMGSPMSVNNGLGEKSYRGQSISALQAGISGISP